MDAWVWVVIAVAIVAVVIVAWMAYDRRRSHDLQTRFGPEYDRTMERAGERRAAEGELLRRRARHDALDIHPLDDRSTRRSADAWRVIQARFVDEPETAFNDADSLVLAVMRDQGYPMDDFQQRADDLSVEHADVVEHYRAARRVALALERGRAQTEDLRRGMVHYRSLFQDLLTTPGAEVR